jgi:hypothetical protein
MLNLLTALSLLLCVGVGVPWVASVGFSLAGEPGAVQGWRWATGQPTGGGAVRLRLWNLTVDPRAVDFTRVALDTTPEQVDAVGIGLRASTWLVYPRGGVGFARPGPGAFTVRLPPWAVVLAAGVLPAVRYARHRRRRFERSRAARGMCPACGYDLRATPGRCPECGTIVPAAAAP